MSPQLLSVYVLLVFLTVVLLKAYAIGIVRMIKKHIFQKHLQKNLDIINLLNLFQVWRCYKYLTMRQHNIRSMLPYIIPEISARQVTS